MKQQVGQVPTAGTLHSIVWDIQDQVDDTCQAAANAPDDWSSMCMQCCDAVDQHIMTVPEKNKYAMQLSTHAACNNQS